MKISSKGYYAIKALLDLAGNFTGTPIPLSTISKRQYIPLNYLEQLFVRLRRAKIVQSTRGPKGGYKLLKTPKEISIKSVIKALDISMAPVFCVDEDHAEKACEHFNGCISYILWKKVGIQITQLLDSITIADLIAEGGKAKTKGVLNHDYIFYI